MVATRPETNIDLHCRKSVTNSNDVNRFFKNSCVPFVCDGSQLPNIVGAELNITCIYFILFFFMVFSCELEYLDIN